MLNTIDKQPGIHPLFNLFYLKKVQVENAEEAGTLEDWYNLGYYHAISYTERLEMFRDVDRCDAYTKGYNEGLFDNLHM